MSHVRAYKIEISSNKGVCVGDDEIIDSHFSSFFHGILQFSLIFIASNFSPYIINFYNFHDNLEFFGLAVIRFFLSCTGKKEVAKQNVTKAEI